MDRRIKYTQKVIKDTLLNLLEKKDIANITVTEICEISDINRGTFYRYYMDVYDLLKNIEQEFINEIKNSPSIENIHDHSIYSFTKGILSIFENNKKLVKILFNTDNNVYFLNEVLDAAYEKCMGRWEELQPDINSEELENSVVFIFNGALGVINYWIKNDFSTPTDDLAKYIEMYCLYGAKKYLPKNKQN
ncbi:MAG: TetR/AcrR family transcriptional regulator [Bacilli bacterium]|nr:TetR/AcrR family transcriptional regulator [Bacilli bacterium]MBR6137467.1 TetR/AcrR family transcriptional regulator [Bacilli bacterium]